MLHHRCVNTFHKTRLFMLLFTLSMAVLRSGQDKGIKKNQLQRKMYYDYMLR